jgi:hypothetical protein
VSVVVLARDADGAALGCGAPETAESLFYERVLPG